jgi:histidyl-tRNA synthetase
VKIQAVRGMQDLLPRQKEIYRFVEDKVRDVLRSYGYQELGFPVIESTSLFSRLVGEATDVVEKEMYTFADRNGDSLTLRPEGTAGIVRLAQENGLVYNQVQRFWYSGPMFRHERPQKGRYRQFEQIGAECFGMPGPDIDVELQYMASRMWKELGISDDVSLELNSLGSTESRATFREELVKYFSTVKGELDEDSLRRLETNPLRILDSKVEKTKDLLQGAPLLSDFLDSESRTHFDDLRRMLDYRQIPYRVNPLIVRGLDYYNKTVFEWVTDSLGSQGAVCSGGRYDGLVEQVGGKPTPGVGFAMGLDRIALMLEPEFESGVQADIYIASAGDKARIHALTLAEDIRDGQTGCKVVVNCGEGKFKSQLKKADNSGASLALILGDEEVEGGQVTIKHLRESGEQKSINANELDGYLADYFSKE